MYFRVYCQGQLKNSLPKLLKSFDWSDHKKVAIVSTLYLSKTLLLIIDFVLLIMSAPPVSYSLIIF